MALLCLSVLWSLWKLSVTVAHNCNNKFILYSRTGTVKSLYFPHSLSSLSAAQTASQKILSKVIIDLRADRNLKSCKNRLKKGESNFKIFTQVVKSKMEPSGPNSQKFCMQGSLVCKLRS